jgi:hypothetical protein
VRFVPGAPELPVRFVIITMYAAVVLVVLVVLVVILTTNIVAIRTYRKTAMYTHVIRVTQTVTVFTCNIAPVAAAA